MEYAIKFLMGRPLIIHLQIKEKFMSTTNKLNQTKDDLNKVSESIVQVGDEIKKQADEYTNELAKYIKGCPIKSVLIAALLGLLVGKVLI